MRKLVGVSRRTDTVVNLCHVCHMAVVGLVQVSSIPACLEVNLCTQTVDAHTRVSGQVGRLRTTLGRQTGVADGIGDRSVTVLGTSPSHARLIGGS